MVRERRPLPHWWSSAAAILTAVGRKAEAYGWDPDPRVEIVAAWSDRCDIPRVRVNRSLREALRAGKECGRPPDPCLGLGPGWALRPWLFEGLTENAHLAGPEGETGKAPMLRRFGGRATIVSDSLAQSRGRKTLPLAAYVAREMRPPANLSEALAADAADTWYLCNDNLWPELLSLYDRPPLLRGGGPARSLPISGPAGALSFGIGRSGSGLPFHFHGSQFVEVTQGRKRWFVAPFNVGLELEFNPSLSSLVWLQSLTARAGSAPGAEAGGALPRLPRGVMTCSQGPGETLYLPPRWWHATLNVGETVFFLDFV